MKLRTYQSELITNISLALTKCKQIIATMPTGSGKTFTFAHIAKLATNNDLNTLIITDRIELMNQTGGALEQVGLQPKLIEAGADSDLSGNCHIGMIETINSRVKRTDTMLKFLQSRNLIIIDECHKANFDKLFQYLRTGVYVIGFTATPIRMGKRNMLKDYYCKIISGPGISELQLSGYLCKSVTYGKPMDLSSVRVRGEDYDPEDQRRVYGKLQNFDGLYENMQRVARGKKTLIFCANVKASKELNSYLQSKGLRSAHLDGGLSKDERSDILDKFKSGEITHLCSISVLTTGFDEPSIECIVLYRATRSLPLYLQMCGRGGRPYPGKNTFSILDFGNNVSRFGYWEQDREWSLSQKKIDKLKKTGETPVKICYSCGAMIFASARVCRFCGHEMSLTKEQIAYEKLIELHPKEIGKRELSVKELEAYRREKAYKQGWLLRQLRNRSQFFEYAELMGYKKGWAWGMIKRYLT